MKVIYDSGLGTTIKDVYGYLEVIDLIKSNESYTHYILSTPNRTNVYWNKSAAIEDIKETSHYAEIVHILTVNNVLIIEY